MYCGSIIRIRQPVIREFRRVSISRVDVVQYLCEDVLLLKVGRTIDLTYVAKIPSYIILQRHILDKTRKTTILDVLQQIYARQ